MAHEGTNADIAEDSRALFDLASEVTSTLDLQQVLDRSLAGLRRLVPFGGGSIQLLDDDALALAASDPPAGPDAYALRVPVGRGVGGRIVESGEPMYIPDISLDDRVPPASQRALSDGVRSYFGVPLILAGHPIGIVQIDSPEPDGFSPRARGLLVAFAPVIASAVQNARLFGRELATVDELIAARQLKNDFLSMVSHELRTPLTSLTGFAELLAHRADTLSAEMVAEFGRRMWRSSRWLSRMIGDLLDLAQIERGSLVVDNIPIDVTEVVKEVAAVDARDRRPIATATEERLPLVSADPQRLRQVLGNLLSNARKFSPPGSRIDIEARRSGQRVAITVTDHGRGIPREQIDRIFGSFVQVDQTNTRREGGLGTGLYLVKHLCDRMGAEIGVESEEGRGSRFTVWLVAADAALVSRRA
jgi:signal transduction histidine kinase